MTEYAETTRLPQCIDDLERHVADAKTKLAPLRERTDALNRQAVEIRKQLGELAERLTAFGAEVVTVQQEILAADQIFDTVAVGFANVRSAAEQAASLEAANQTLSSMFGEAFQVVSRFFETAQRLGLVAKDAAAPCSVVSESPLEPVVAEEPIVATEPANDSILEAAELSDWQTPFDAGDELPPPVELPPLPDVSAPEDEEDSDVKDVEALLAGLSTPIST